MQPADSDRGGIKDSVISGDVHHHHYADSQLTGQTQQIIIDPNTGLPQNVMIIQQESSAPQVIGILVIIYGAIGMMGASLWCLGFIIFSK